MGVERSNHATNLPQLTIEGYIGNGHTMLKTPVLVTEVKQHWAQLVLGWDTIEGYLSYLLPTFEDLVSTSLGSGAF